MLFNISKAVFANDINGLVSTLQEAIDAGRSASQIVKNLIVFYRNLLLVKLGASEALELSQDYLKRLKEEAESYAVNRIKEILKALAKTDLEMKWHSQARILLEVALLELLEAGNSVTVTKPVSKPEVRITDERRVSNIDTGVVTDKRFTNIKKHWKEILDSVKKKSLFGYVSLHEGQPVNMEENKLIINFKKGFGFHKERLEEQNNKTVVESAIKEITGEEILIGCRVGDSGTPSLSASAVAEIFN